MNANDPGHNTSADRNLLIGVLALQMDFIRREDLIAATSVWLLDKTKGLDQILLERQALQPDEHALLVAVVAKHLARHDGDPRQSLAALSSINSMRDELERFGDAELSVSLSHVSSGAASDLSLTMGHAIAVVGVESAARAVLGLTGGRGSCRAVNPEYGSAGASPSRASPSQGAVLYESRFRVIRPHAEGGLGRVSVAHDEELHREVALKEIKPQFATDVDRRNRFTMEAEITGGLEHPGIVQCTGWESTATAGRTMRCVSFGGTACGNQSSIFMLPRVRKALSPSKYPRTSTRRHWSRPRQPSSRFPSLTRRRVQSQEKHSCPSSSANCWGDSSTCVRRSSMPIVAACFIAT